MSNLEDRARELITGLDLLFQRFVLTEQRWQEVCETLRKQELRLIDQLGKNGSLMISEIAERIGLSMSSVSGLVESLVERGMVTRERSDDDRRVVRVALTDDGLKMYQQAWEVRLKLGYGMLSVLSREEQDALLALFQKIADRTA